MGPGILAPDFSGARGRVIDVKPGELRGAGGLGWQQGACFGMLPPGAMDSAAGAMPGGGFAGGSWSTPVPPPSSAQAPAYGSLPGFAGQYGPSATRGQFAGGRWGLSGFLSSIGNFGCGMGYGHSGSAMPTEAEVTDSYASFGVELQQWTRALATLIDLQLVEPLIRQLEDSDRRWQQDLTPRGWRLTTEAPRIAYPGAGPQMQEVSVFDRWLPRPLSDFPDIVEYWKHRQKLENYLVHPCFDSTQRQYVLERLHEWRHRGLVNAFRSEWRPSDTMPTDAHILENLVIKMLHDRGVPDFANCFMASGSAPPLSKHLGQSPVAYLRQVADQTLLPRPAPHYEVVTRTKIWKLRPGNLNVLEALGLLLHALRRHSRSYKTFPQEVQAAVEVTDDPSAPTRSSWF